MIAIGSDHGGFALKQEIILHLTSKGVSFKDFGCFSDEAVDYPDYAKAVTAAILNGECTQGILICGTGIGISIAANKVSGIRCALCHDVFSAEATRLHNNANVLALGGRVIGPSHALKVVDTFLSTPFSNDERHVNRINKIENC
ncbi:MAG: rpiB [Clostridia bacterium]|jgi:ribose 5-phosphate isomerase B|nr:rpiB [Clostridia bacterium]